MTEFWMFFQLGLRHVLDIRAYDLVLFLIALTVPYAFKDWKRLLLLITVFTISHTVALLLSVYGIIVMKVQVLKIVIPIVIFITALFNLFTAGKSGKTESINLLFFVTLFFGIIHGLVYAPHFKMILAKLGNAKLLPISELALGIEAGQIIVVFVVLVISYIVQTVFRFSKRDWALVMSSFIMGVVVPLIIESELWNR